MKQYRSVTIKGVTFPFSFSVRVMSYYMRKKRMGVAGADQGLPTALQNFGTYEIAEIYLVCMWLCLL